MEPVGPEILLDIVPDQASTGFHELFNVEVSVAPDWEVVPRINLVCHCTITMGMSNDAFQGLLTLGTSLEGLEAAAPGAGIDLQMDGMGEVLNQLSGLLNSLETFVGNFGVLIPSPPVQSVGGLVTFPRTAGVQGRLLVAGREFIVGCAVRPVVPLRDSPSFAKLLLSEQPG